MQQPFNRDLMFVLFLCMNISNITIEVDLIVLWYIDAKW